MRQNVGDGCENLRAVEIEEKCCLAALYSMPIILVLLVTLHDGGLPSNVGRLQSTNDFAESIEFIHQQLEVRSRRNMQLYADELNFIS